MRWGIQDQATDDHSTVDLCLRELDQCCRFSLATNCVVSYLLLLNSRRQSIDTSADSIES